MSSIPAIDNHDFPIPETTPQPKVQPKQASSSWEIPKLNDLRIPFAAILTFYGILGVTLLGFNRTPWQLLFIVASGSLLDMGLARVLHGRKIIPLSAYISCCSIGLLLNYAHSSWILILPVFLTIASKYILTFNGRHVFNPSLFGLAACLLFTNEVITAAPAYQWAGGDIGMTAFVVMAAVMLFVLKVGRTALIVSFLVTYLLQTLLRAYIMRHHLPPEMLIIGTFSAPSFFIFTFYMMTDPGTSPKTRAGQIAIGVGVALLDLVLHFKESVFTFFYAAFAIQCGKFFFLHFRALWQEGLGARFQAAFAPSRLKTVGLVGGMGLGLVACDQYMTLPGAESVDVDFKMHKLDPLKHGFETEMGDLFNEVDPRIKHVAKWVMSVGDAVAIGDYDNDGYMDMFLTQPLKADQYRATLYRNKGDLTFDAIQLPAMERFRTDYKNAGLPSGATFVDYDGDGDQDLAIAVGWGRSILLQNQLIETGAPDFKDVSADVGLDAHTVSLGMSFMDVNQDASLDLLLTNALTTHLTLYDEPTEFNVFKLPEPEFEGDRRMLHFMHNGWHNADNGGSNDLYLGEPDGTFTKLTNKHTGINETRWSLAAATADFNVDGKTDVYIANDFGPDNLYLNRDNGRFESIKGRLFGDIGRDTYKGMNATTADFDRNGMPDIYISNVHHSLQAEGSLLWMTYPGETAETPSFIDEATRRGALNERRFGWGADAGDLNNDGWIDIVQANGMVDDSLDHRYTEGRKDYWYVNQKLMQSGPEIHTYADMWGDIRGRITYPNEARRAYLNMGETGEFFFIDIAEKLGIDDPDNSRGVAMADFDNDGDLDLVVTNQHRVTSVYQSDLRQVKGEASHFVGLNLVGNGVDTHRSALGTRVKLRYKNASGEFVEQFAELSALSGFSSQGDPRIHFGLGTYDGSVEATIYWYGAKPETVSLSADAYYTLEQ